MKKFNLSQIMKTAHNLRKNCPAKYTTFSAALKQSWKMAKFDAMLAAQRPAMEAEAKAQRMREEIAARKEGISYSEYQDRINRAYGYGCGMYCGD